MSDLFENEIKLGVFWPIIAELCLMELPHLKNREKNPATSVFIRMYLGRARQGIVKDSDSEGEASTVVWEVPWETWVAKAESFSPLSLRPERGCLITTNQEQPPGGEVLLFSSKPKVFKGGRE